MRVFEKIMGFNSLILYNFQYLQINQNKINISILMYSSIDLLKHFNHFIVNLPMILISKKNMFSLLIVNYPCIKSINPLLEFRNDSDNAEYCGQHSSYNVLKSCSCILMLCFEYLILFIFFSKGKMYMISESHFNQKQIKTICQINCFYIFQQMKIAIVSLLLVLQVATYTKKKTQDYFKSYDENSNNLLQRQEYVKQLKKEDQRNDVFEDQQYYKELTDLIYEKYDLDTDQSLSVEEWHQFATDIVDEGVNGKYGYSVQELNGNDL